MRKTPIKVTLKYHPNKALGEKYEVVKITNAVVVEYDLQGTKKSLRVSDTIAEADAKALAERGPFPGAGPFAEVTVIPE